MSSRRSCARIVSWLALALVSVSCGKSESSAGVEATGGAIPASMGAGGRAAGSGGTAVTSGGVDAQGSASGSAQGGSHTGGHSDAGSGGTGGEPSTRAGSESGGGSAGMGNGSEGGASDNGAGNGGVGAGGESDAGDCTVNCAPEYLGVAPLPWVAGAIALDADGSYFEASLFAGTRDFDPGPRQNVLTAVGESELWVSKYSAEGTYLWTYTFGRDGNVNIAAGPNGGVYVSGAFSRVVATDPVDGTQYAVSEPFIARIDAAGKLVWQQVFRAIDAQSGGAATVASDDHGNAILAANFEGTVDFDSGAAVDAQSFAPGGQGYLFEYDSTGARRWQQTIGGEDCGFHPSLLAVSADAMVVAGSASIHCVLDGRVVDRQRPLVTFSRTGVARGVRMVGGVQQNPFGLLAFDDGAVVLSGGFDRQLTLDDDVIATEDTHGTHFVLRVSTGSGPDWVKTSQRMLAPSMARTPDGGIVTSTAFEGQTPSSVAIVVWRADGTLQRSFSLGCLTTPFVASNSERFLVSADGGAGCDPDPGPGVADAGREPFVARYHF
jgi:hypothetical protein